MADRRQIEEIRSRMAEVDLDILRLLEQRARLAREIGALGDDTGNPVLQQRERLDAVQRAATGDLPAESVRAVFRAVHAACAALEGPTRVAFVGVDGSFGAVATRQMFGPGVRAIPTESAAAALDELARGRVDFAVAPYETSQEGPVLSTILALKQTDLMVIGQCEIAAGVALLSRTGNLNDIEKVYASAHDHANSHVFLNTSLPRASVIDVRSPTIACQFAAEDHGGAAIAHETIGDAHGLVVVLPNVGDEPDLRMRYAVIGTRPSPRTGEDVTSLVFTLSDEPGALLAVLGDFAKRGINVKNVMSRPAPGEGWDYVFYMDVMGHATDRAIVAALDEIKKNTRFLKVLGSYPTRC
jgi:chorismate mutase/prephenate dehydratase